MPSANLPSNTPSSALTILATNIRRDSAGRYCLNDCHKASGGENAKRPSLWAENAQTKALIAELEGSAGNPAHPFNVVTTGPNEGRGTYGSEELVLAYAQWISPAFHVQCLRALMAMMRGESASAPKRIRKPSAMQAFKTGYGIAKIMGLDDNQASLRAARYCHAKCGENPLELMGHVSLPTPNNETHYTPTQIGEKIGTTGRVVNILLIERGYQCKDDGSASGSSYVPTEKGKPFARFFDTTRRNGSGSQQQLKWSEDIIPHLSTR